MNANVSLHIKNEIASLYTRIVTAVSLNPQIMHHYAEIYICSDNLDVLEDADIVYEHKTLKELADVLKQFLINH